MKAEIIVIGDEILIGQVIDTNSAWMAEELNKIGIAVHRITKVGDDKASIINALKEARKYADVIFTSGGLGPTKDDKTKDVFCKFFNVKLKRNAEAYESVKKFFASRNLPMIPVNEAQADLPENCEVIPNSCGTAPGLWFENITHNKFFIALPGVPYELKAMMSDYILPKLMEKFKLPPLHHLTIHTVGIGESFLAEKIKDIEENLPAHIKLAYLPQPGIVRLRISGSGKNIGEEINSVRENLEERIRKYIFGYGDTTLEKEIGKILLEKKKTLAVAESCTGGYMAYKITSVPGSSGYFLGGIISYDNSVKINQLKVPEEILKTKGAVSEECATAMAKGVREILKSDIGISTTGIAGPDGGTEEKPVGTIWIGYSDEKKTIAKKFNFQSNREKNIIQFTVAALNMVRKNLLGIE